MTCIAPRSLKAPLSVTSIARSRATPKWHHHHSPFGYRCCWRFISFIVPFGGFVFFSRSPSHCVLLRSSKASAWAKKKTCCSFRWPCFFFACLLLLQTIFQRVWPLESHSQALPKKIRFNGRPGGLCVCVCLQSASTPASAVDWSADVKWFALEDDRGHARNKVEPHRGHGSE